MADVALIMEASPGKREKADFWSKEFDATDKRLRKWRKQGARIVKRYIDDRGNSGINEDGGIQQFRLNLFHRNVATQQDMLYNNIPIVEVSRSQEDASDDVARVAGNMIQRILNLDLQNKAEDYDSVLRGTLQDRLLPGLGCARVRYEVEQEEVTVDAVIDAGGFVIQEEYTDVKTVWEDAPIDYFYWQDVAWGWSRSWADMPWLAFASYLTKDEICQRFGEEFKDEVQYEKQKVSGNAETGSDPDNSDPHQTAQVWEIWDKESKKVRWWSKGCDRMLDTRDDPLELRGFYPAPPFFIANPTTTLYMPTPDFHLTQDLYNEVDRLQTRIAIITEAVKVVGVYDAASEGVQRMMKEGVENELIPVDNWAMWAEKGGLRGQIDWLPIETIAGVLDKLIKVRDNTMGLLQIATGMGDIMQGALNNQYEGVGQSQLKAQAGSVSMQALQGEFATFASNLMQLKAEVICKHFDPETIVKQSNMMFSMDKDMVPAAVQLLKQPEMAYLRIEIKPESIAMIDYAKLKQERTEWLTAFSTFLQSSAPLIESKPESLPFLLEMLQWTMAGFKGSNEIEGVLDKMVDEAKKVVQQSQGQEKPDPALQVEQMKQQGELQKIQAKAQADMQIRQQDMQMDIATENARHQAKMQEIQANMFAESQAVEQKLMADLALERAQTQGNVQQTQVSATTEVQKSAAEAQIEIAKKREEAQAELEQQAAQSAIDIEKGAEEAAIEIRKNLIEGDEDA